MKDLSITIAGSALAFYGAIVGTATAAAQVVTFFRDRANVKLTFQRGMELLGDPRYSGMTLTHLTAANRGRRPVTITVISARYLFPGRACVFTDTRPPLPIELTEGRYVDVLIDEAGFASERVEAFEARDAVGRTFRRSVAPFRKRFVSWLRRRFAGTGSRTRTASASDKASVE